jgi:hypothetical protein
VRRHSNEDAETMHGHRHSGSMEYQDEIIGEMTRSKANMADVGIISLLPSAASRGTPRPGRRKGAYDGALTRGSATACSTPRWTGSQWERERGDEIRYPACEENAAILNEAI